MKSMFKVKSIFTQATLAFFIITPHSGNCYTSNYQTASQLGPVVVISAKGPVMKKPKAAFNRTAKGHKPLRKTFKSASQQQKTGMRKGTSSLKSLKAKFKSSAKNIARISKQKMNRNNHISAKKRVNPPRALVNKLKKGGSKNTFTSHSKNGLSKSPKPTYLTKNFNPKALGVKNVKPEFSRVTGKPHTSKSNDQPKPSPTPKYTF